MYFVDNFSFIFIYIDGELCYFLRFSLVTFFPEHRSLYWGVSRARHAVHFHHKAISDTRCLYTLAFNSIKVYNKQPCITSPHSGKKITELRRAVFRRWCAYLNQLRWAEWLIRLQFLTISRVLTGCSSTVFHFHYSNWHKNRLTLCHLLFSQPLSEKYRLESTGSHLLGNWQKSSVL